MTIPNYLTVERGTTVHILNQFVKLTRSWCSVIILMPKSALGGKFEGWREKSRRHACLLYHCSYLLRQHWQREKEKEVTKFHERSCYNSLAKLTIKKCLFFLHYKNTRACKVRKSRSEKETKTRQKIPNPDAEPSIEKAHSQIKIRLVPIGQRHTVVGL